MHPFTTFLTHIAASLTGCGNWRGYASKAAEERRQRFSKTRLMIISIDLFFFFSFANGNWNEEYGLGKNVLLV